MTAPQRNGNITTYHSIPESHGGAFTFSGNAHYNIGTSDLRTCVGVYIPINDSRCFFAHILARRAPHPAESNDSLFMHLTDDERLRIRNEVYNRLQRHSEQHGWSVQDVRNFLWQNPDRNIVVMCPCYLDVEGRPGVAVLQGLEEFIGGRQHWRAENGKDTQQGFVVDHSDGTVSIMQRLYSGGRSYRVMLNQGDPDFVPVTEPRAMKEWQIEA